jgi:hypothetical protein
MKCLVGPTLSSRRTISGLSSVSVACSVCSGGAVQAGCSDLNPLMPGAIGGSIGLLVLVSFIPCILKAACV